MLGVQERERGEWGVTTTVMPVSMCPSCFYVMDMATSLVGEQSPAPGDVTVCARCGEALFFNDRLIVERMSNSQFFELPCEIRGILIKASKAVRKLRGGQESQ